MRCDTGCGECCGVVPVTTAEFNRVKLYASQKGIVALDQGVTCPFYQEGTCKVYKVRPLICQLYGHTKDPKMTCPRGYNTNIPERIGNQMILQNGDPDRLLHELIPEFSMDKLLKDMKNHIDEFSSAPKPRTGV